MDFLSFLGTSLTAERNILLFESVSKVIFARLGTFETGPSKLLMVRACFGGRAGSPAASSEKANSSLHFTCFTLAAWWLPPGPSWVVSAEGWPRSHGHRLTLLFMARARLTAAPERGNIAHLAGLLGAVMPQRPALWQAINVPREKRRASD